MTLSPTMHFVLKRAEAEARHRGSDKIGAEDAFLAILKLSEIRAEDFLDAPSDYLKAVNDREIHQLKFLLTDSYGVDTSRLRAQLRHELKHVAGGTASLSDYLKRAEELSAARKSPGVFPCDLLNAIIERPTVPLQQVCDIAQWGKPGQDNTQSAAESGLPSSGEEMSIDFLPQLTERIRRMRAQLLSTVQGQDHVVHAFAEGMFAAEVLAAGDEKRKRPRAAFAFVGPPGVGKTFLAEQAAEALSTPFKRFDMSAYADHQAYLGLVGFEKSYKDARQGTLTGFVKENPHSILLFDEIEKAHLSTIQLFLQIFDAGRLTDRFLDEDIVFRDTIIIFTSNAGRSLYEGDAKLNAAGIPRKTILSSLETEKDPRTGQPFFPSAITSRLATGWPLLFNHLQPHDLEKISGRELGRLCGLFEKQYGIKVKCDNLMATALLFREGGAVDARILQAQTEVFFKNEVFKICRLWGKERFSEALHRLQVLQFSVETDTLPMDARSIFFSDEKPELLLYCDPAFAEACREKMPQYTIHATQNVEEALTIAGERDVRLALLDVAGKSLDPRKKNETVFEETADRDLMISGGAFDYAPMAASVFRDGGRLFRALRERLPELPVYLLEMPEMAISGELMMDFVRAGARGKLTVAGKEFFVFEDMLASICRELYLQSVASRMASEKKVLFFETAPKLSEDEKEVTIRLRDFSVRRAAAAEDAGSVLDEVEKPSVRFQDVIGAADAKDELRFFIDYLKNPKRFSAQGLKPPKGILLYGPPGTGKTLLARAMAGESDAAFIPTVASSFVTKWQGSGPESVRDLFQRARRYAPAILFIDEIDAVGRKRGGSNTAHGEEMALNALLTEMDGFSTDPKRPVFVLAATNFEVEEGRDGIGVLDPALVRRFDRRVLVDLPNAEEREALLRMLLRRNTTHIVTDGMLRRTAERAMGMSPATLTNMIELANRMAVKAKQPLDDTILDEAFELTKHGKKKDWGYEYLERVARHESGHAFMCYLGGNTPSYLTVVARGGHGGYMEHSAKEMGPLSTKEELIHRIRTSLGGRAAEIAYYGEADGVSTGASGDLEQATRVAAAMLCAYGMDEEFGLAAMDPRTAMNDPAVRRRVNGILREEMGWTVEIILKNKPRIDRLVEALMRRNKLTGEEIDRLLSE